MFSTLLSTSCKTCIQVENWFKTVNTFGYPIDPMLNLRSSVLSFSRLEGTVPPRKRKDAWSQVIRCCVSKTRGIISLSESRSCVEMNVSIAYTFLEFLNIGNFLFDLEISHRCFVSHEVSFLSVLFTGLQVWHYFLGVSMRLFRMLDCSAVSIEVMYQTRETVSSGYPCTETDSWKYTTRSGVFLTKFELFG